MRLAPTSRVPTGALLGRDIRTGNPDGVPLLRAGIEMTDRYREKLLAIGVNAIYIEDADSEGIIATPIVSDHTKYVATRAVSAAFRNARDTVTIGRPLPDATIDALRDVVDLIMREVQSSGEISLALEDLAGSHAYTFEHSIDVTALGLLLGQRLFRDFGWIDYRGKRRYDRIEERLSQLGLGLLLHDIGKLVVPTSILDKPGKLTPEEFELIKTHPRAGCDLLQDRVSPLARAVVLGHHERHDGTGYPDGKSGTAIHQFARIAAVADVYDAITSERVYAPARPACDGVRAVRSLSGVGFDPEVVDVFSRLVAPFPPGTEVKLVDGREGIVASVPSGAIDRPVVRILTDGRPYSVELEKDDELRIEGWPHEWPSLASTARG